MESISQKFFKKDITPNTTTLGSTTIRIHNFPKQQFFENNIKQRFAENTKMIDDFVSLKYIL